MAYKRGQEVFRDPKPFLYYVQPNYRKIVCDWCLKLCESERIVRILKTCTKCKWVYYCDQTCQKEAWNSHHKSECRYLQKQNMPQLVKEVFDGNVQELQEFYLKILKTILKLKNNGREEFFQLPNGKKIYFADLTSNAVELRTNATYPIHIAANGLYLGYSILDHSCAPNAAWFNIGKEMVVRIIEDVEDFSEIRISYVIVHQHTQERRKVLKEKYFIDCK